jgi:hypothetical protein
VGDLLELLLLAVASAFYPVLLAVVIIFLGRPHPKRLLLFFLAGAMLVSVSIGIAAVNVLNAADIGSSGRHSFGAAVYFTIGIAAIVVGAHFLRTRPKPKKPKKDSDRPSLTERALSRDSSWLVFALGIVLNLPGLWYLAGLKNIGLADYSKAAEVALVLGFNVIMFSFIEIPLLGYLFAPEWSQRQVTRFNGWLHRNGRHMGGWIGVGIGCYLLVRGILALV